MFKRVKRVLISFTSSLVVPGTLLLIGYLNQQIHQTYAQQIFVVWMCPLCGLVIGTISANTSMKMYLRILYGLFAPVTLAAMLLVTLTAQFGRLPVMKGTWLGNWLNKDS